MTIGIDAYPLAWPLGWKRTPSHQRSTAAYKVDFGKARDELARELALLCRRSTDVVISSNVPTRRDGLPYTGQREPDDPGVAAYWIDRHGQQRVIACDAWRRVRENLRAVGLAVAAFRMIERTKASEILDRAFIGFAALPPAADPNGWRTVFGLENKYVCTIDFVESVYRKLAAERHPDRGGSHERMVELNKAMAEARKELE